MKKVMVFGTFDILHPGHLRFLRQAKKYGDQITVVVARDQTVLKVKKRPAGHSQRKRIIALKKIPAVDKVLLGNSGDKLKIIEQENPDIICLGYDQKFFTKNLAQKLADRGLGIKIIRLKPYHPEKYKSSKLK